ncbi:MAG TPA: TRAP transporter substrate-binding protein [Syntrophorhabdaceae bacterium]|nr:TRAP transporter substrate-binding protein [Syntrophorhabdaceae bacterium]
MKKRSFVVIGVFFILVLSFFVQADAAETAKPIELRFSMFLSLDHTSYINGWRPFAQELERRSKGRVKVTFYPSETLGKAKDHYDMTVNGIADLGMSVLGFNPGRFPLAEALELPIAWPSCRIAARVCWDIYEKYLKKEFSDVKLIALATTDPNQIMTSKKAVRTLADLSGVRLKTGSPRQVDMVRAWGGSPINIPITDTYEALQRGMLDGIFTGYSGLTDFKLHEQLSHYTTIGVGVSVATGLMNLKTWNSLPPDIQKIITDISGSNLSARIGDVFDKAQRDALAEATKLGGKVYTLSSADKAALLEKSKPIVETWIANVEKKGLPGRKIYEDIIALVDKYSKEEAASAAGRK